MKTCKSCEHWKNRTIEDDGYEHGYGRHKLEDGRLVDIGICQNTGKVVREIEICDLFELEDNLVLPW